MEDVIGKFLNKKKNGCDEWRDVIEDMLNGGEYRYAEDILIDFLDFIDKNDTITDGQIQAIENIKSKPTRNGW